MTPSKDEVREPSSMEYTPDGKFLIVAYKTGIIWYLEMVELDTP